MRTMISLAAAMLALSSSLAGAEEKCSVPLADWKPRGELEAMLKAKGWDVRSIKTEDGCYEAYAIDEKGNRVEAYFNPQTFDRVGASEDGEDEG